MRFETGCGEVESADFLPTADRSALHGYANFQLVRPAGHRARVVAVTQQPILLAGEKGGQSIGELSGPKPNFLDSFSIDAQAAAGWSGPSLSIKGELRETHTKTVEAAFPGVRVGHLANGDGRATLVVPADRTVNPLPGVRITLHAQSEPMASVPLTLEWTNEALFLDRKGSPAEIRLIETSAADPSSWYGGGTAGRPHDMTADLGQPRVPDGEHTLRVKVTWERTERAYPFTVPLRLKWRPKQL